MCLVISYEIIRSEQAESEDKMVITNLEIHNFRGIKTCNIQFPVDTRLVCFIGSGDSTKSTILKAIEWIFYPSWNLLACDNDFYGCDTANPIILRGTFAEIPEKLLSEDKFGLYLRKPNAPLESGVNDEPESEARCLTVQLTIDGSLEPKWEVVCNRKEARPISPADRRLLSVGIIGSNCAKDMVWGKYSVLQKYADAKGVLHDAHTAALREIATHADLRELDEVGEILVSVGEQYGVGFEADVKNRMIVQNGSFSSAVGLFDGNTPLNQRGTGSQRLLSMGLNIQASEGNTLLLIDEVESGLEPYRLRSLINEFRKNHRAAGQVIMTTHSPIAVAECTIGELWVVQSQNGETKAYPVKSSDANTNKILQAEVRANAEAFLSKRLIVCEGKTEIGFVRAMDTYLSESKNFRMACKGIGVADGGGDKIFRCINALRTCGYDVCVFMDSDKPEHDDTKFDLDLEGVPIFDWDKPNAIEEQIFRDAPIETVLRLMNNVVAVRGFDSVKSRLSTTKISFEIINDELCFDEVTPDIRAQLGTIAKNAEWFKRIDFGEQLGTAVFDNWEEVGEDTRLKKVVQSMVKWVIGDDRN